MRAVNLLPREDPKRRKVRMTVGTQLALVSPFVIASLIVAGFLLESSKVNDSRATLKALQQTLAALPKPDTPATQTDNAALAAQQAARISALSSALQSRVAWDRILREISSVLPEDVWLTALSAQSPAVAPAPTPAPATTTTPEGDSGSTDSATATPPPTPTPVASSAALSIGGYTYSQEGVARFLGRLAVIPELQNVKLVSATKADMSDRAVVQFSITADIRPQVAA